MRSAIREYYDRSPELTLRHPWYREQVERFLVGNYRSDVPSDATSKKLLTRSRRCRAVIRAKQPGILAGCEEVTWFLRQLGILVYAAVADGSVLMPEKSILKLSGPARAVLATERTVLNALQHLSGVATQTQRACVMAGRRTVITATRKTLWGGLDKRAVTWGGGLSHRLHLGDGIMVKDNHLALVDHDQLQRVRFNQPRCTLEVASLPALKRAVIHYPQFTILLLDNFSVERLHLAIHWLETHKLRQRYIIEASGGITLANLTRYAKTGVDVLSLGALTHSAAALDLSLDIIP